MHIRAENLQKRFDRKRVLCGVDLDLPPGAIVALVGVNGAGKTTLLHALAGLLALNRGEVKFDGELFRRDRLDLRRRFLFLPDFPYFALAKTLVEHIALLLQLYGRDANAETERVLELLSDFDMLALANQPIERLSRGEFYKAALCGLIAVNPDLWLLDEPLASGMDPLGLRAFQRHARIAAGAGRTILFTTQILEVAERFADYAAVLHEGRIRAFAPCSQLRAAGADGGLTELFASLTEAQA